MPYRDKHGRYCGFLDIEEQENSGHFVRRYFLICHDSNMLEYFMDNPQNLPADSKRVGGINLGYISMVQEGSKARPKEKFCFFLTVAGSRCYLRGDDSTDRDEWISVINDACKIIVPSSESESERASYGSSASYKAEIVGGVVVKTPIESATAPNFYVQNDGSDSDSSCDEVERDRVFPMQSQCETSQVVIHRTPVIKDGYCIKQGGLRKNWKRRWFTLNVDGLSYFKTAETKKPIRTISKAEILEARISIGIHINRDHIFEIVTPQRVFYLQVDTSEEVESWITAITNFIKKPQKQEVEVQTDLPPPKQVIKASRSIWV